MNTRKVALVIALVIGYVVGTILTPPLNAYSERDGGWTATEKRQIINLLEQIRDNTGE